MRNGLEQLKLETATELGIQDYDQVDKGLLPSRVNGMVGGMMVRKMIKIAEGVLAAQNQLEDGVVEKVSIGNSITDDDRRRVQEAFIGMNMLQGSLPHASQVEEVSQVEYHYLQ